MLIDNIKTPVETFDEDEDDDDGYAEILKLPVVEDDGDATLVVVLYSSFALLAAVIGRWVDRFDADGQYSIYIWR